MQHFRTCFSTILKYDQNLFNPIYFVLSQISSFVINSHMPVILRWEVSDWAWNWRNGSVIRIHKYIKQSFPWWNPSFLSVLIKNWKLDHRCSCSGQVSEWAGWNITWTHSLHSNYFLRSEPIELEGNSGNREERRLWWAGWREIRREGTGGVISNLIISFSFISLSSSDQTKIIILNVSTNPLPPPTSTLILRVSLNPLIFWVEVKQR